MAPMGADITGTTTSRKERKGREDSGTAEYVEYTEGGHLRSRFRPSVVGTFRRNVIASLPKTRKSLAKACHY